MAEPIDNSAKRPQGTNFTNINDIVRANRENRLGNTVSGGVQKTANKGRDELSGVREQFQNQSQAGAVGNQQDQSYVNQTLQNPMNTQQSDYDRFARLRSGQYQGPQGLGNQQQLQAHQQDLQGIADASGNAYGQRGLLQRFVGQPQYTQGQQRLDSLLLGQTGGEGLKHAKQEAGRFGHELNTANQQAQVQAQALANQSQQFGQQLTGQLGQAQTDQEADLNSRMAQQQQQSEAARSALQALFSKPTTPTTPTGDVSTMPVGGIRPNITQSQFDLAKQALDQGGLSNKMLYGPEYFLNSPDQLLGQGTLNPTIQQTANEQDKARAIALGKLSGNNSNVFTPDTQVGGYNPLNFLDQGNFNSVLKHSEDQYKEASPYAQLMGQTSLTNPNSSDALGSQYRPTAGKQADAIKYLAEQTKQTDPAKAAEYERLASQLGAYGQGRGFLFGGDEGQYFRNMYNNVYDKAGQEASAYPGGAEAINRSSPVSLIDKLKSMING